MMDDPNFLEERIGGRIIRILVQPRRFFLYKL